MVAMAPERDQTTEVVAAIEELVASFGLQAVLAACIRSSAGGSFEKYGSANAQRMINWVLARVIDADDPRLEADIMALGAGLLLRQGMTVRSIAKKYGLTPAAVSKRVIEFCDRTGLEPSYAMKPTRLRKVYALTNRPRR